MPPFPSRSRSSTAAPTLPTRACSIRPTTSESWACRAAPSARASATTTRASARRTRRSRRPSWRPRRSSTRTNRGGRAEQDAQADAARAQTPKLTRNAQAASALHPELLVHVLLEDYLRILRSISRRACLVAPCLLGCAVLAWLRARSSARSSSNPQGEHELGARGEVRRHYKTLVRRHFKML